MLAIIGRLHCKEERQRQISQLHSEVTAMTGLSGVGSGGGGEGLWAGEMPFSL